MPIPLTIYPLRIHLLVDVGVVDGSATDPGSGKTFGFDGDIDAERNAYIEMTSEGFRLIMTGTMNATDDFISGAYVMDVDGGDSYYRYEGAFSLTRDS